MPNDTPKVTLVLIDPVAPGEIHVSLRYADGETMIVGKHATRALAEREATELALANLCDWHANY